MNRQEMYDVIVVGAGCAGPAAAKKAADLGLKTLLIEKAQTPGEKNVSGTCLNAAALVDPDLHYLMEGPVEREIRSMKTHHIGADRTTVFQEIPSEGILLLSVRRDHFDAWHTKQAERAGAEIRLSTSVVDLLQVGGVICGVVTDSGEHIGCKIVIDAGGVNSIAGRRAGLIPKRTGTSMILYVTLAIHLGKEKVDRLFGDTIEYYLSPGCQHKTWPWIFPKRDVVTLGTGGYMTPELISSEHPSVNSYMQKFMSLKVVKDRIEGGKIVSWGLHLEHDEPLERRTEDGIILAGEAGGFVAPFLGEGMPEAFFTGIYAAQAAAEAIEAGDLSGSRLEELFASKVEENLFMQSFMYVARKNKESILSRSDGEIVSLMQSVIMGGGFITNCVHTGWLAGADEESIEKVQEARDYMDFIQPYRGTGSEFETLYRKRRSGT
jgi:electron transfer flavoprotein-quinone oxidoreductase